MKDLTTVEKVKFDITPRTFEEAQQFAHLVAESNMVPQDFRNNPGNCLIAMQMGAELGIPPLQALQNIAVVNGRPTVWGDLLPALAQAHPQFEYINESFDESSMTATCAIKRKKQPEQVRTFSQADATLAGIWGRNTWKQYPKRMLQMRARSFAVRDVFPDALKGTAVYEDIIDLESKDYSVVESSAQESSTITADQAAQIEAFIADHNLPHDDIVAYLGKSFSAPSIAQLPANAFGKVMSLLSQSAKKRQAADSAQAQEPQPEIAPSSAAGELL